VSIAQFDKLLDDAQAIEKLCNNKNITYKWNTMKYDPKTPS